MGKKEKLFKKAKESPTNLSFNELCRLAIAVGFVFRNQNGSHKTYKHPTLKGIMNFQPDKKDKSKAKLYQTKKLVEYIEEKKLI